MQHNTFLCDTVTTDLHGKGWSVVGGKNQGSHELVRLLQDTYGISRVLTHDLCARTGSSNYRKSLTKSFGLSRFPFHTDGANLLYPPRIILLLYKGDVSSSAATTLIDGLEILKDPHIAPHLYDSWLVNGASGKFYTTVYKKVPNRSTFMFRYNPLLMQRRDRLRSNVFDDYLQHSMIERHERVLWQPNLTLIIDNWRMLHARDPVPSEEATNRKLQRISLYH